MGRFGEGATVITVPKDLRRQEENYGNGFSDGYDHAREVMRAQPLTRSDWWLWAAATLGFFIGRAL